ncbi:MAG: penicillin-binding transpeptidase domain-containing protein [Thermodesulfobacteriota bacterium]|nr:penicillin-binding transpeptidase domain-containing protein [Thermodesulfobacteriota bacterium]
MKIKEKKWIRFRIYAVAAFFLLGLGTVWARAYQLQVLEREYLKPIADDHINRTTTLPSKRGTIYDRGGHELALSVETGSLYAHPNRIEDKADTAMRLSLVLGERQDKVLNLLKSPRSFIWIVRRIPQEQAKQVKTLGLNGVGVVTETRRYYPGREIASHLMGFVGLDNQGLEGLEARHDRLLKGPEYRLTHMSDALSRPFAISSPIPSGRGMHNLILTIDKDIQYKAQQVLKSVVYKTRARAGHCLVVVPETGEILAMAVVPEFNPNIFSKYKPHQWRNRTITDCFEPGSTIKAFLLAACLEESVAAPQTNFDCEQGEYKIGAHVVHDAHEFGVMSVSDIIARSSNIGAIKIGQELGYEKFCEYLRNFGFGSKTGVELLGERKGFIRSVKDAKPLDQCALFFGQGLTTTSLQLTMAMAVIANGGKLMRPYVVKAVVDDSGDVIEETHPKIVRRILSNETARKAARILENVVSDKGTGAQAAINGFRVAGKTGTAQKVDPTTKKYSGKKYVATFVGFVPVRQPRFVILAVVDEPQTTPYGGVVAAPVFSEVGEWSLNYFRVNPQLRVVTKGMDAQADAEKRPYADLEEEKPSKVMAGFLPDFRGLGMREVLRKGRSLGLKVLPEGTGLAIKQMPGPGAPLQSVSKVEVMFRPPT